MPYKSVITDLYYFESFISYYNVFVQHLEMIESNSADSNVLKKLSLLKQSSIEPFKVPDNIHLEAELRSALKLYTFSVGITMGETYLWSMTHRLTKNGKTKRYESTIQNSQLIYRLSYAHEEPYLYNQEQSFEEHEASPFYFGNPEESLKHLKRILISSRKKITI